MSACPGVPEPAPDVSEPVLDVSELVSDVSEPVLELVEEEGTGGSEATGELVVVTSEAGGVPWFCLCLH